MHEFADLAWDEPTRDIRVKSGNQTSCGGIATALVDFEPAPDGFEFVDLVDPESVSRFSWDLLERCVRSFEEGVCAELSEFCGEALPPVRVVLRWILVHEVDSNEYQNRRAGRLAVAEAIRRRTAANQPNSPNT